MEGYEKAIMACRAWDLDDYTPMQRAMYDKAVAQVGAAIPDYDGRVPGTCSQCGVKVQIGPRQSAHMHDPSVIVVCMVCVPLLLEQETQPGDTVDLKSLDNPQSRL